MVCLCARERSFTRNYRARIIESPVSTIDNVWLDDSQRVKGPR